MEKKPFMPKGFVKAKPTHRVEFMWLIVNNKIGSYCGTNSLTRKDAIANYVRDMGQTWVERKKQGDRCVKAEIIYPLK